MNGYHLPGDRLPPYLTLPEELLDTEMTATEERAYMLLLRRSFLSARSPKWTDGDGRVFLCYPVAELAGDLRRGMTAVKTALKRLEELDLIERRRQGRGKPNRIYVKFPCDLEAEEVCAAPAPDPETDAMPDPETDAMPDRETDAMPDRGTDAPPHLLTDGKAAPSYLYGEKRNELSEGSKQRAPARAGRERGFLFLRRRRRAG